MVKIFSVGFSSITFRAAHTGTEVGLCLWRWVRALIPVSPKIQLWGGSPQCPSPWTLKLFWGQQWIWSLEAMFPTHTWLAAAVAAPGLAPVLMPSHCHPGSESSLGLSIEMKSFFSFHPSRH